MVKLGWRYRAGKKRWQAEVCVGTGEVGIVGWLCCIGSAMVMFYCGNCIPSLHVLTSMQS